MITSDLTADTHNSIHTLSASNVDCYTDVCPRIFKWGGGDKEKERKRGRGRLGRREGGGSRERSR